VVVTADPASIRDILDFALARHTDPTGQVLNVLTEIQAEFRYIPVEALQELSRRTGIAFARLYSLCTFFQDFSLEPVGKYLVMVCDGTACHIRGAMDIVHALENVLGIQAGQTTPDERFTLRTVHCVGSCGLAPIVVMNIYTFGRVRLAEAAHILKVVE